MGKRDVVRAIGLSLGLAAALSAQTNLNRTPAREVGHPQLTLSTRSPNLVEGRELYQPQALALDTAANVLYVSDSLNNRILAWKNASGFSNGAKADFVIGQKDFYSTASLGPGTAFTTGLYFPTGMTVDRNGNLYVIDSGNNRILRFPKPYDKTEQFPDLVIGQTSLSCSTCRLPNSGGISAKSLFVSNNAGLLAAAITFDSQGNLWFTDAGNNRVLRYNARDLGPNASFGPAADLVLGQLDFTTGTLPPPTPDIFNSKTILVQPNGLAFDPNGRLYVSDSLGCNPGVVVCGRVLMYQPNLSPQTFDNGRAALRILGIAPVQRPGATIPPINQYQFLNPTGIFMIGNRPGVVDSNHHRLVLFDPIDSADTTPPTSPPATASGPIGQFAYSVAKPNRDLPEPRNNTFYAPSFALATATELYVVDSGNNRIVVLPTSGLGPNSVATRVLGQDDFVFGAANLLEGRELNLSPLSGIGDGGLLVDLVSDVPHLYIADTYNHRVLGYRDVRKVRPGDKADLVIGQPDFQRAVRNYPTDDPDKPNAQGLFLPIGLALDSSGNLFVADSGNGRVLRFPKPFDQTQPNFPSADLVLGQASLTSKVVDPTQRTMRVPYGLAFTSNGGLLVSDSALNRVLLFGGGGQPFTDGMSANKVFGQPDFFSFQAGSETNQMNVPKHIATDSDDRLYVADENNNRVLISDNVLFAGPNSRAVAALQGPNINSGFGAVRGIFVSKITGEIWTTEANNNRILRFPRFDDLLFQQNAANFVILSTPGIAAVAVAQDSFGDVFVGETSNRIAIYYPGLTAANAANANQGRAVAPGAIVTLNRQGSDFSSDSLAADPTNWPTELNDLQVFVNDSLAPIKDVSRDQINFLMPMNTPNNGTVEVQVIRKSTGQILGAGQVNMATASPALFTRNGFGVGQLLANNDDGAPNEPGNPIVQNKCCISVFGTGQGFLAGAPPDGQAAGGQISTDAKPRIIVGSDYIADSDIQYSGLAPGLVGVWQIDFKVPTLYPGKTTGPVPGPTVPVYVVFKNLTSPLPPQQTTIAVKQP